MTSEGGDEVTEEETVGEDALGAEDHGAYEEAGGIEL
jgi:hypothetical protein